MSLRYIHIPNAGSWAFDVEPVESSETMATVDQNLGAIRGPLMLCTFYPSTLRKAALY